MNCPISSVLLEILFALITGIYSGFIMYRYTDFKILMRDALNEVRGMSGLINKSSSENSNHPNLVSRLRLIAHSFKDQKHGKAQEIVSKIADQIDEVLKTAATQDADINSKKDEWQKELQNLTPSKTVLLFPF